MSHGYIFLFQQFAIVIYHFVPKHHPMYLLLFHLLTKQDIIHQVLRHIDTIFKAFVEDVREAFAEELLRLVSDVQPCALLACAL